jgi:hypothetical protein
MQLANKSDYFHEIVAATVRYLSELKEPHPRSDHLYLQGKYSLT